MSKFHVCDVWYTDIESMMILLFHLYISEYACIWYTFQIIEYIKHIVCAFDGVILRILSVNNVFTFGVYKVALASDAADIPRFLGMII